MTNDDTLKVCEMLVHHTGVKPEDAAKAISLWTVNLRTIEYPKAQEAIKSLLMQKNNAKTASRWLADIVTYCGGSTQQAVNQKVIDNNPGCEQCRFSGCIEVPHRGDWELGRWKGMYTMVVACECPAGQLRACQMMNIRQYASDFPQWREEYPRRRVELQLREMDKTELPKTKAELAMHNDRHVRLRTELDFLNGDVPEFEVSH